MYTKYFNFSAPPFQLTPDPRFLFESSVHARAIAHLQYGLNQGEGFIVVTGEVGAGKTTIIGHLSDTLDRHKYVATTIVTTNLDGNDIIRMIAAGLGITQEGRDKASILCDIENFLHDCSRRGKKCLIFVDEAQNLSISALEELRMLSNIHVNGLTPVQLFLLGQPQFRHTLARDDMLQLRQRVIASYHLGPMEEDETRDYVLHRLRRVGWQDNPRFDEDAFRVIYRYTEGLPRRINTLCSRLLLFCYLEEIHDISAETVDAVAKDLESEFEQVVAHEDENAGEKNQTPAPPALAQDETAPQSLMQEMPAERWKEVIDLIESTPVEALAALGAPAATTDKLTPGEVEAATKERPQSKMFRRLLLLILEEYLKGRPQPHRQ